MHLEQHTRVGADRRAVVREPRLVGGTDFHQAGAALSDHVRYAETAADLDQFASRDDHLAAVAERTQRKQNGCRSIVDRERRFRRRQLAQQRLDCLRARSASTGREVEFQIAISRRDLGDRRNRFGGERGAAEIGVQNDSGCVDRSTQSAPPPDARASHRRARRRFAHQAHRPASRPRSAREQSREYRAARWSLPCDQIPHAASSRPASRAVAAPAAAYGVGFRRLARILSIGDSASMLLSR